MTEPLGIKSTGWPHWGWWCAAAILAILFSLIVPFYLKYRLIADLGSRGCNLYKLEESWIERWVDCKRIPEELPYLLSSSIGVRDTCGNMTDDDLQRLASLRNLKYLDTGDSPITANGMKQIARMSQLTIFRVRNPFFGNSDLIYLSGLQHLNWLFLDGMQIDDEGLVHLSGLTNLEIISLDHNQIRGPGLVHFAGLKKLTSLRIPQNPLTDEGLAHLAGKSDLLELNLADTQVTDAEMVHLTGMTKLHTLCLSRTQVTDAGIAQLAGLKELQYLELSNLNITDASLDTLRGLKKLHTLHLAKTKITPEGAERLRADLPKTEVVYFPPASVPGTE